MERLQTEVGKVIRAKRKAQGLTLEQLSETSGLHEKYIGGVERGEINLTLANLAQIAKGLKCNIGDLFPKGKTSEEREILASIVALLEKQDVRFLRTLLKMFSALD